MYRHVSTCIEQVDNLGGFELASGCLRLRVLLLETAIPLVIVSYAIKFFTLKVNSLLQFKTSKYRHFGGGPIEISVLIPHGGHPC